MNTIESRKENPNETSLVVVIATYNEVENLPSLTNTIWQQLPEARIIVVDDNSPDGTGDWVRELQEHEPRIALHHRSKKEGLGRAAIDGLLRAFDSDAAWIATMDADHSHDPRDLLTMVNRARDETRPVDVVIGSRYISGGRIENWSLRRKIASRIVNGVSRWVLCLATRDNTSAFRVYRADRLRELGLQNIRSRGHVYLEEMLMRLKKVGARITEVPITFRDRTAGKSSLNLRGLISNMRELLLLVFHRGID